MARGNCVAVLYFKQGCVSRLFFSPAILLTLFLFAMLPFAADSHAQGAAGVGSSGTDAAIKYCAEHPGDTSKCIPPDKDRPAIPLPAPDEHKLPMVPASTVVSPCPGCANADVPKLDLPAPQPAATVDPEPDWDRINSRFRSRTPPMPLNGQPTPLRYKLKPSKGYNKNSGKPRIRSNNSRITRTATLKDKRREAY